MKTSHILLILLIVGLSTNAQVFNFYSSQYYLSPDSGTEPGTILTASGTDLSSFNYSNADPNHPLFTTGIFYPVQDCGNQNLWVRVQHIAHDPNGTENGFNISQTLNSPFHPFGSADRIGGWAGFLYDFQIFADQQLTGVRDNVLDGYFPTNITVESLETLYNNGSDLYEWLSFVIMNEETTGWTLNSINFTGINPYSNPGFSSELNYSTTATTTEPPTGFSTTFPSGSATIYAVDLNLSGAEHSEFRMSAGGVSQFQYGYEFTTGGYQGMSMAFGGGPVVNFVVNDPLCSEEATGSVVLDVTGYEPITYDWSDGSDSSTADDLAAGTYNVTITDAAGCSIYQEYTLYDPTPLVADIFQDEIKDDIVLEVVASGGTGNYTYIWNDGSTAEYIVPELGGAYSVMVIDENGCVIAVEYFFVSLSEFNKPNLSVYPNPCQGELTLSNFSGSGIFQLFNSAGHLVYSKTITTQQSIEILLPGVAKGTYGYRFVGDGGVDVGWLVVE